MHQNVYVNELNSKIFMISIAIEMEDFPEKLNYKNLSSLSLIKVLFKLLFILYFQITSSNSQNKKLTIAV